MWHQRCKVCSARDKFEFGVTDECWEKVVPKEYQNKVVCLPCFDSFASQKGIKYGDSLAKEFYFVGDILSIVLEIKGKKNEPIVD